MNKIENIINQINSQNLIILEGTISVLSALSSHYARIAKVILKSDAGNIQKILVAAKEKNIKVEYFSPAEFAEFEENINKSDLYSLGKTHGGIVALAEKRRFLTPEELLSLLPRTVTASIAIIEGIEDPYNLGYAVRALYTQGTGGLILPERDFGFSESVIEKASTGTFSKMPIAVFSTSTASPDNPKINLLELLKSNGFKIYCINKKAPIHKESELQSEIIVKDIFDLKFADRTVFIIGGEKRGISRDFLYNADEIVRIPYANDFAHSLAAQTVATIVSYEIHRQIRSTSFTQNHE
ncbi:MAG: RNA methyltransferase [Oscillospiraceae bacterium]|nr:RNA methyltransferase [Oscillospiraceae bacterium]